MSTTTSISRTWRRRLDSGTITQAEARQYVQAVLPLTLGLPPAGRKTNLREDEASELAQFFRDGNELALTPEHTQKGLDWLRRYGARSLVEHTEADPYFPTEHLTQHFDRFTFCGLGYVRSRNFGGNLYITDALPVWRIHFTEGAPIDYFCGAWQSRRNETKSRGLWWYATPAAAFLWPEGVVR